MDKTVERIHINCPGAAISLIGNPVEIGGGPAAVIGDESRKNATFRLH